MIDDTITNLFKQFSEENLLEYNQKSLPYRPYGEIKGTIKNSIFQIYIYQPESRVSRGFVTVFAVPVFDLLPEGFCIDHIGNRYIKNKSFDELIQIRSYESEIVTHYLNDNIKNLLIETFNEIHKLETSLFKIRSSFRISDKEISLSIGRLFQDIEELNKAYLSIIPLLESVKSKLPELSKHQPLTNKRSNQPG